MARLERRRGRRRCQRGALWEAPHTGSAPGRQPSPGAEIWLRDPARGSDSGACVSVAQRDRGSWLRVAVARDGP